MPSGIGNWRRPENSARFVGKRPREEDEPTFGVAGEADNFRIDHREAISRVASNRVAKMGHLYG